LARAPSAATWSRELFKKGGMVEILKKGQGGAGCAMVTRTRKGAASGKDLRKETVLSTRGGSSARKKGQGENKESVWRGASYDIAREGKLIQFVGATAPMGGGGIKVGARETLWR